MNADAAGAHGGGGGCAAAIYLTRRQHSYGVGRHLSHHGGHGMHGPRTSDFAMSQDFLIETHMPAETVIQRLRARVTERHWSGIQLDEHSLVGEVHDATFDVTIRPAGQPPYTAMVRGRIAEGGRGSIVAGDVRMSFLGAINFAFGLMFTMVGVAFGLRELASGTLSRTLYALVGVMIGGGGLLWWTMSRYRDEQERLLAELRDIAGV